MPIYREYFLKLVAPGGICHFDRIVEEPETPFVAVRCFWDDSSAETRYADVHDRYRIIVEGKSKGIGGDNYYGYVDNLYEVVQSNLSSFGINSKERSVLLIKGLVQETLKIDQPVAFAHIDVDWYAPRYDVSDASFPEPCPWR